MVPGLAGSCHPVWYYGIMLWSDIGYRRLNRLGRANTQKLQITISTGDRCCRSCTAALAQYLEDQGGFPLFTIEGADHNSWQGVRFLLAKASCWAPAQPVLLLQRCNNPARAWSTAARASTASILLQATSRR